MNQHFTDRVYLLYTQYTACTAGYMRAINIDGCVCHF